MGFGTIKAIRYLERDSPLRCRGGFLFVMADEDDDKPIEAEESEDAEGEEEGDSDDSEPKEVYPDLATILKVVPDASKEGVRKGLPHIFKSLCKHGMTSKNFVICTLAKLRVEIGGGYMPLSEIGGENRRYAPWYGRGFGQCTHEGNYKSFSEYSGTDIIENPELLNTDFELSAENYVWFMNGGSGAPFDQVRKLVEAGDWLPVRQIYNAGGVGNATTQPGTDQYMEICARGEKYITKDLDPDALGVIPDSNEGLGCADGGSGSSQTVTSGSIVNQGTALMYALGMIARARMNTNVANFRVRVADYPAVLDLNPQQKIFMSSFGQELDGAYICQEVEFLHDEVDGNLIAWVQATKPDPDAPPVKSFVHGMGGAGLGSDGKKSGAATLGREKMEGELRLKVPYLSQLDNANNPTGSCNVTSIAMALQFYGIDAVPDDLYTEMLNSGLIRHSPQDLAIVANKRDGVKDEFSPGASIDDVRSHLDTENPGVIHGYFTNSGHIVCVVGYNEKGLVVHDPYGKWLGGTDYDTSVSGEYLTYSYESIEASCLPDGTCWLHKFSKD